MSYEIIKTVDTSKTDGQENIVQIVKVSRNHVATDFDNEQFVDVDTFRFESGHIVLGDGVKLEITRVLMTCDEGHNHGVYYQAPRQMELWEAMFAIGEVNPIETKEEN
jgi:hypothetical protein